jgi:hypothetical protein
MEQPDSVQDLECTLHLVKPILVIDAWFMPDLDVPGTIDSCLKRHYQPVSVRPWLVYHTVAEHL